MWKSKFPTYHNLLAVNVARQVFPKSRIHTYQASQREKPRKCYGAKKKGEKSERKRRKERERRKWWAAKGRAQRLYRLLIVRLWSIILSENGHFHVEGSNYARFPGYYYTGEGLHRRSGRGPRNRGALLKASPTDRTIPCTRPRLIYKVLIAGTWAGRKGRNSIGHIAHSLRPPCNWKWGGAFTGDNRRRPGLPQRRRPANVLIWNY